MSDELRTNTGKKGRWTVEEQNLFNLAFQWYGKDWKKLGEVIQTRSVIQIRSHAQKMEKKMNTVSTGEKEVPKVFILPTALNELNSYVSNTLSNSYKIYMDQQHRLMYSQEPSQVVDKKNFFEGAKGEVDSS